MKTFKEYRKNKQTNFLSWPSSFRENEQSISEEIVHHDPDPQSFTNWNTKGYEESLENVKKNDNGGTYDRNFHDHEDVKPRNLSDEHKKSIARYTSTPSSNKEGHGSSGNMNSYLRNSAGDKTQGIKHGHHEGDVEDSINKFSSAFTPENTNKKEITTYGAVPHHIGMQLQNSKKGDSRHFAGFTSTSSVRNVAHEFTYSPTTESGNVAHIVKYKVKPGAGLSTAHHSEYDENEVTLNHGARIEYSHTRTMPSRSGKIMHIHTVTVHPDHKPLEEYGEYNPPKK
jgi:hypothetical protein